MPVDIKVIGEYPRADFIAARVKALDEVGRIALAAEKRAAPVQRGGRGGHDPGTLRDALKTRRMGKGAAIKVGIIGAKSPGFYGRFVEYGHKIVVGRVTQWNRRTGKNGQPMSLSSRKHAWKKDRSGMRTIGTVPPHPFFFDTYARLYPEMGDTIITGLENAVTMEKVSL